MQGLVSKRSRRSRGAVVHGAGGSAAGEESASAAAEQGVGGISVLLDVCSIRAAHVVLICNQVAMMRPHEDHAA